MEGSGHWGPGAEARRQSVWRAWYVVPKVHGVLAEEGAEWKDGALECGEWTQPNRSCACVGALGVMDFTAFGSRPPWAVRIISEELPLE